MHPLFPSARREVERDAENVNAVIASEHLCIALSSTLPALLRFIPHSVNVLSGYTLKPAKIASC